MAVLRPTTSATVSQINKATSVGAVALYWIPLGAGGHFVRFNGVAYEAVNAAIEHRARCDLYHSALELTLPSGRYMIEMTPVPDALGERRGVVAEGPVGTRAAGRFRRFRYEVRRWRDGVVPDLADAVGSPVVLSTDGDLAEAVFQLVPSVPSLTWGRDEVRTGELWSCNSITSWILTAAGVDVDAIVPPPHGRAPGWRAGITVARRDVSAARSIHRRRPREGEPSATC